MISLVLAKIETRDRVQTNSCLEFRVSRMDDRQAGDRFSSYLYLLLIYFNKYILHLSL